MKKIFILLLCTQFICAYAHDGQLIFIENKGQWESTVKYKMSLKNGAIFLEQDRLTVHIRNFGGKHFNNLDRDSSLKGQAYQIQFVGANLNAKQFGNEKTSEYFNYFLGSDSSKWRGACSGFHEVYYQSIYPNIDLKINSSNYQPKYTFVLRKGARVSDIRMKFTGLNNLFINFKGDLISSTIIGDIVDEKPISYKINEGQKKDIESSFQLDENIVSFQVSDSLIQEGEVLEIDPQIIFSTYSGSTADNFGASATYDYAGNLYGTGLVFDVGYPTTSGAYDVSYNSASNSRISDIAITKFNQLGSARIYSTYIGGSSYDAPHSLVVDDNNRLILLATTSSSNYPRTAGAYDTSFNGGPGLNTTTNPITALNGLGLEYPNGADLAITKFNAAGTGLIGSTFFGGNGTDGVGFSTNLVKNYGDPIRGEVETDSFGNVYIASMSNSTNLPTLTNSSFTSNAGGFDGILIKFNTTLTNLLGFTYYGGSGDDAFYDLCFDRNGNIQAAGGTASSNITMTSGAVNSTYSGNTDGMITSFNNNLSTLRASTYFGTSDYDQIYFVETDRADSIFVYGQTTHSSTNYFLLNAAYSNAHKGQFISVLSPLLTAKVRSTMFGAGNQNPDISPTAFLVDYCSKIFVTGWGTNIAGFNTFQLTIAGLPITSNAFQSTNQGNGFYMMILEGDFSALHYGTYFGGTTSTSEEHVDGGTSRFDKNGIVYHAVCAGCGGAQNFPIYPNASSVVSGSNNSANCNLGVFKFDFGLPVNADFTSNSVCAPGNVSFTNLSHVVSTNPTYQWSFSNGQTSNAKNPVITFSTSGVYTARLIVIDTLSCNFRDTITKNVIVLGTTPDTLSTKTICPGSSVRIGFTGVIDPTLTFRWTPTSSIDDTTILSPFASPTSTTTYRVIVAKTGCIDTFYQKVIVDTPPTLAINGPSSFCVNAQAIYTTNKFSTGSYDWFPKNILISNNRDSATYQFTSFPTTISVSYINQYGCVSSATKTITQGTPNLDLKSDSVVCKGDIVEIIKTTNINGGTIAFVPAGKVISQSGDTTRVQVDTTMYFYATYSLSANCVAKDTIHFILLNEVLKWSIDSVICFNTNAIATATISNSYTLNWQPQSKLTTTQGQSPANFNLLNTDQKVYIKAIHNTRSFCQFNDSVEVRFLQNLIKLKADQTKCRDSNVTIYTGKNKQGTYIWSPSANLVSTTDSSATFQVKNSRYYYLTIIDNNGCTASDSIFISVVNDAIKTQGDSILCPKDTAALTTTVLTGATYQWLPGPLILSGVNSPTATAIITASQWFYVHIQDTNNCYIIDSVFVRTFDSTNVLKADFTANTNCQNLNVQFTNTSRTTSSKTSYSWDFAGQGNSTAKNPSFSFTTPGLQNVKLIAVDTNSCNFLDTIRKTVLILNNSKINLPELLKCKGDTIQIGLEAMKDSLASIFWTPKTNMIDTSGFNPRVKGLSTIIYSAIISKNGCRDTVIQKLNIDSPSVVKISGDNVTCSNGELLFTATKYSTGIYTWTPFANLSYLNQDSAKFIITQTNTWVKVKLTTNYGCNSYDSIRVSLITPSLSLQMDSLGCKDEILDIKYSPIPKGGAFSFNPNSNILSSNDSSAKFKVDTSRMVVINYKINNSCQVNEIIRFKLLQDAADWKYDSIVCKNKQIKATALTHSRWRIQWGPNTLLQSPQGSSPATFGNFLNDQDIYFYTELNNRPSCQYRDTARVMLLENYIKLTADGVRCSDSFSKITTSIVPNSTYTWSPTNALLNTNGNTATFKTNISRYYSVRVNYNNLCEASDSIYIKIANDDINITADSVVCNKDTVTLSATFLPLATYVWSNGKTTSSIQDTIYNTTVYTLLVIDSNKCRIRDTFTVKTLDTSNFKFLVRDTTNCRFDTLKLEMNYLPGVLYQWYSNPATPILSGNGTHKIKTWINQTTKFKIYATIPKRNNCSIEDSITVVKDTNYLKVTGKALVCRFDTVEFRATNNPSFTYSWNPSDWILNNRHIVRYIIVDSTYIKCEAKSSIFKQCKYIDSIKVDYNRDLDNLTTTATPPRIEYGKSSQLQATAKNIIDYVWSPKKTLSNQFIPSPIASPKATTAYYVTVTDKLGCRSSDSVIVDVYFEECRDPEVFLPTGFTPNKDAKNDALYVRGDNIEKMILRIYDRWGQLIFEALNQKKGWDGTFNGVELEPAVFAYYLWVECIGGATYTKSGNITLIK